MCPDGSPHPRWYSVGLLIAVLPLIAPARSVAQDLWIPGGPEGGVVRALASSAAAPEVVYAGTPAGVFKRSPAFSVWRPMNVGLTDVDVRVLAIAATDASILFAATPTGVFKTTNGAASWTRSSTGLLLGQVAALAVDPTSGAVAYAGYAGTPAGLFKTTDGGATWQPANSGLPAGRVYSIVINPVSSATVYASVGDRIFKSVDGGLSWAQQIFGFGAVAIVLSVDPQAPDTVYAAAIRSISLSPLEPALTLVYRTTDGGANWTGGTQVPGLAYALVADPSAAGTLYVGSEPGLRRSIDGGVTWSEPSLSYPVLSLAANRLGGSTLWAGTTDGGTFTSDDAGLHWTAVNQGLVATVIRALAVDPKRAHVVYAAMSTRGVFRSADGGVTWSPAAALTNVSALAVDGSQPATVSPAPSFSDPSTNLDPLATSTAATTRERRGT